MNLGAFQPFVFHQLGGGTYLRSSAVCPYNFENSTYSVPIGLGIGKVIPREKVDLQRYLSSRSVSIADKGAGWPEWQIFFGFNTQFK